MQRLNAIIHAPRCLPCQLPSRSSRTSTQNVLRRQHTPAFAASGGGPDDQIPPAVSFPYSLHRPDPRCPTRPAVTKAKATTAAQLRGSITPSPPHISTRLSTLLQCL
ncbi:unnamed protein product [Protopolystoma xenopodis]|uniref:Uncharacterized protein n=1 Tax=Protopolystoma xenopodis TaxID=117903 RepID=A0A448XHC8_9PLAT|nr:unnamed protein product [Protopolystoma xenopodis]